MGRCPRHRTIPIAMSGLLALPILTTSCAPANAANAQSSVDGSLSVLYAGSLTKIMEKTIAPDFERQSQRLLQGEGAGSTELAQMIASGLKQPDVFISASPAVNDDLLFGPAHSDLERWYATLATDQLVIAYSPSSRFAPALRQGSAPWYEVLLRPGFLFGRTDPKLDPKGLRTLLLAKLAERYYHRSGLAQAWLGDPENQAQVFPEEVLLSRLTTGQLDAVVAYKHEAVEWGVPYVSLPPALNLGDLRYAKDYQSVTVTLPGQKPQRGAPIVFTIATLKNASHPDSATAFIQYMLTGAGHQRLLDDGFGAMPTYVHGDQYSVPGRIRATVQGAWPPVGPSVLPQGGATH